MALFTPYGSVYDALELRSQHWDHHFKSDAKGIAQPLGRSPKLFGERSDKLHPQMAIVCDVKCLGKSDPVIFIDNPQPGVRGTASMTG